jgi:plasmid maintenance system antidote protein VapI
MALRLSKAFPNSTPENWLNLQRNYDLWQISHRNFAWKSVQPMDYIDKEVPAQKISLDKQIRLG